MSVNRDPSWPVPPGLEIERADVSYVVLRLSGELDVASVPALEARLRALWQEGCRHVVLDLGRLSFVDSAGVSVLIRSKDAAANEQRTLVLRRASSDVQSLFALLGITNLLSFEDGFAAEPGA